jgi:hypothetical protein
MSALSGEFVCPVEFGRVEVVFKSYLNREFSSLNVADFKLKFFPSAAHPDVIKYRNGELSDWDYQLDFGADNYGIFQIKGVYGVYRIIKGAVSDVAVGVGLRITCLK